MDITWIVVIAAALAIGALILVLIILVGVSNTLLDLRHQNGTLIEELGKIRTILSEIRGTMPSDE